MSVATDVPKIFNRKNPIPQRTDIYCLTRGKSINLSHTHPFSILARRV